MFFTPLLMANSFSLCAQVVETPYEVCTWGDCTEAAITFTFDDATSNQYSIAIPMFNEYGFKATFYPVINWSPNWTKFKQAVDHGHEVGSHTMSHPYLDQLTYEEQDAELKDSQDEINSKLSGQSCLTIAYSYCVPSDDTITGKYYIAARHCQGYTEKTTPEDFLNISSIICRSQGSIKTTKNFIDKSNVAAAAKGWNVYLLHGIDSDGGYSPLPSDTIRATLEYYDKNRAKYWVSSFVNVVRYIRERNAVSVQALDSNEDTLKVNVTDTLENSIYDYPVSIRCPLPEDWEYAQAFQEGDSIKTFVKEIDSEKYIVFNAVPDEGVVKITSAEAPIIPDLIYNYRQKATSVKLAPNPFDNEIHILADGGFSYTVHTLDGKVLESGKSISFQDRVGSSLGPGLYIISVKCISETIIRKILKF